MLTPDDREFLLSRSTEKRLTKGQFLYQQGDKSNDLFILLSGAVKVHYLHDQGSSLTVSYYREGMLVGAHCCTQWAGNHIWSAQVLVDGTALKMRRSDLVELVERSTAAMRCILAITEFKAEQLRKVIRILSMPALDTRVAVVLYHLGSLYGISSNGEIEIDGRFTHQEIAEMVGASRQSVTMVLLALEKSGQIRRDGRKLFVRLPARRYPSISAED